MSLLLRASSNRPVHLWRILLPCLILCASCGQGEDEPGSTGSGDSGFDASGGTAETGSGGAPSSGGAAQSSGGAGTSSGGGENSSGGQSSGGAGGGRGAGGSSAASGGSVGSGGSGGSTPDMSTIVPDPSWDCGKPGGLAPPELGQLVFAASLPTSEINDVGQTQFGQRRFAVFNAGSIDSDQLDASFLDGSMDFELTLENGSIELEQVAMLRAADGSLIYMRSCGVAPAAATSVRTVFDFEVANTSSLSWLNDGDFVGTRTLDDQTGKMELAVYDMSNVTPPSDQIVILDPAAAPNQPWECNMTTGGKGAQIFTESVTLGASLSVGASKNGTRNVIPITGGTVTGQLTGTVVDGGADYQLVNGQAKLDARYALKSNDGEFVVVRNCGAFGALVPTFETRAAGPYAFLNDNDYVSSDPGSANGGVSITFYKRN